MEEEDSLKSKLTILINIFTWITIAVSFFLAALVAIAQTSVPGDQTYGIKIGFEKTVLTAYRLFSLDSRYQIDLTELRFAETKKIIKSDRAFLGLNNLFNQALETQLAIYSIKDKKKRAETAREYIAKLTDINYQLEQEKQNISEYNPSQPTPKPTVPVINPGSGNQPSAATQQENINNQITLTQEQINAIIDGLNTITTEENTPVAGTSGVTPSPTPIPTIKAPALLMQHEGLASSSGGTTHVEPTKGENQLSTTTTPAP